MQKIDYACHCGRTETVQAKVVEIENRLCKKCGSLMARSIVMDIPEGVGTATVRITPKKKAKKTTKRKKK